MIMHPIFPHRFFFAFTLPRYFHPPQLPFFLLLHMQSSLASRGEAASSHRFNPTSALIQTKSAIHDGLDGLDLGSVRAERGSSWNLVGNAAWSLP